MNIYTLNKKVFFNNAFILFSIAFLIRLIYLILQNPSSEKLIEDELLYWNASHILLDRGSLDETTKAERMFGVFIYTKLLLILSLKNLKVYLVLQSILDSLNCFIIYKIGSLILPRQKLYIYISAIISPLMVILSSQVLSETIFLFFFYIISLFFDKSYFRKKQFTL